MTSTKSRSGNSLTVSEVNQDFTRAQRAVAKGPLIITTHGEPSLVLMTYQAYLGRVRRKPGLVDRLHVHGVEDVDFHAPPLAGTVTPAQFD
jgi:phage-related baseplate assembly protein